MSILNNGYIELAPKALSPESELMATFATKNNSGIILAGLSRGLEKRRRRQAHLASTEDRDLGWFWFCHGCFVISSQAFMPVTCKGSVGSRGYSLYIHRGEVKDEVAETYLGC